MTVNGLPEYLITTYANGNRTTQVVGTNNIKSLKRDLRAKADRVIVRKLNNDWRLK